MPPPFKTIDAFAAAFWSKVDRNGPVPTCKPELGQCWIWIGASRGRGYGCVGIPRFLSNQFPSRGAHIVSYVMARGAVPIGCEIDHLCRNHRCVNPGHLEPVTHTENIRRGDTVAYGTFKRSRTHCPNGHPYSTENTALNSRGHRRCRECHRAEAAATYYRRIGKENPHASAAS